MTKTLTEQWREGELPDGEYYLKDWDGKIDWFVAQNKILWRDNNNPIYASERIEVLAPVPSYQQLYGPNDGRIPVGLFTVLKLIKRDIERWQKTRHLTDLECGIKSQVVSLLKRRGWDLGKDELVSNSDESKDPYITNTEDCQQIVEDNLKRKIQQLEKRLEVSEKEHYRTLEQLRIATGALREYANCKPPEWMSCVTADKALKEMEGVK